MLQPALLKQEIKIVLFKRESAAWICKGKDVGKRKSNKKITSLEDVSTTVCNTRGDLRALTGKACTAWICTVP